MIDEPQHGLFAVDDSVVVLGSHTPYVWEVLETLSRLDMQVAGIVDLFDAADRHPGSVSVKSMPQSWLKLPHVLGAGMPEFRTPTLARAESIGVENWLSVIDPTAVVPASTEVGRGVYINAGAVVGAQSKFADFSHLNRASSVGHHCTIARLACIGPGATVTHGVHVGEGSYIGAGAVVLPELTVGCDAMVGAGAVVTRDVPPNSVVVGNPARERS